MLASIAANGHTFDDCKEILRRGGERNGVPKFNFINFLPTDIRLDPGFREFFAWCKMHDIPFIIVSRLVFRKFHT